MIPDGARVEYTGKGMMLTRNRVGHIGVVVSSYIRWSSTFREDTQVVKVLWQDGKEQSVFAQNVRELAGEPAWEV